MFLNDTCMNLLVCRHDVVLQMIFKIGVDMSVAKAKMWKLGELVRSVCPAVSWHRSASTAMARPRERNRHENTVVSRKRPDTI